MNTFSQTTIKIASDIFSLCLGATTVFAFAPFHFYPLAIICPALLLWLWYQVPAKRAAWRGFLFGLGLFGLGISWVFISIHTFGNTSVWIAASITGSLIIILSLYIALQGYLLRRFFSTYSTTTLVLAFPTLWVLMEWLRGWLFSGFPWLFLGYSQLPSYLAGYAPLVSVYGVSFLCAMSAGLLINAWRGKKYFFFNLFILILIWATGFTLTHIQWTKKIGSPLTAVLIQGNIEQSSKWNPSRLQMILDRYQSITQKNWDANIIVWPEAAIPLVLDEAAPLLNPLSEEAKQHHTALITGVPIRTTERIFYNGMVGLGAAKGMYYKRHLVPFGEYVPLENYLRGIINFFNLPMSNFTAGNDQQTLMQVDDFSISSFICYEIAYLNQFLLTLPRGNLIITISDDAWFGKSWASEQQLQISQMRSLESGRYQLVASNNGATAIIDAQGHIIGTAPEFILTTLRGSVYAMQGSTPLVWLGLKPIIIILFVMLFIIWLYRPNTLRDMKKN